MPNRAPVARWRIASAELSGKAKTPAGLVSKAAQMPVDDQRSGYADRVEQGPARPQREVEGGQEEEEPRERVDAVEVDSENSLGRRVGAEREARLGDQAGQGPGQLQGRQDHDALLGEGPRRPLRGGASIAPGAYRCRPPRRLRWPDLSRPRASSFERADSPRARAARRAARAAAAPRRSACASGGGRCRRAFARTGRSRGRCRSRPRRGSPGSGRASVRCPGSARPRLPRRSDLSGSSGCWERPSQAERDR